MRDLRQVGTGGLAIDRASVKNAERYDRERVITPNDDDHTAEGLGSDVPTRPC